MEAHHSPGAASCTGCWPAPVGFHQAVRAHAGKVRGQIIAVVLEVTEQPVAEHMDRVVRDVAAPQLVQRRRGDAAVQWAVLVEYLRANPDALRHATRCVHGGCHAGGRTVLSAAGAPVAAHRSS